MSLRAKAPSWIVTLKYLFLKKKSEYVLAIILDCALLLFWIIKFSGSPEELVKIHCVGAIKMENFWSLP